MREQIRIEPAREHFGRQWNKLPKVNQLPPLRPMAGQPGPPPTSVP
jgi:hypothetical protein